MIDQVEVIVLRDPPSTGSSNGPTAGYAASGRIAERPFLRIRTSDGLHGISELFEVPARVAVAALDGPDSVFGPVLYGQDPFPPQRLTRRLMAPLVARDRAGWAVQCIGAVDVALWDIAGKLLAKPVHALFGGPEWPALQESTPHRRTHVTPYATVYALASDPRAMIRAQLEMVGRALDLGFRAIKVEPVRCEPHHVVEMAREARAMLGDRTLMLDVAYLWNDASVALRVARQLAEFDLAWLETPFPNHSLQAYARLVTRSPVPVAVGEFGVTAARVIELMDTTTVDVVLPYVATLGGFEEMRQVVEAAVGRGVAVCPGGWATQVTHAAHVQVAAWSTVTPYFEYPHPALYDSPLRTALADLGQPHVVDGLVEVPAAPGLGIDLPDDLITSFRAT